MEEKKERSFYKKWWFWVIILAIVIVIGFTTIILMAFNMINPDKNLTNLAKKLQEYDNNITIYQSAGKNTILINCYAKDKAETTKKSEDIGNIMREYIDYLSVYKDIEFYFYTEEGEKATFTFDIATRQTKEDSVETWFLEDSVIEKNMQDEIKGLEDKKNAINTEITGLENKKTSLSTEIEKLSTDIIKLKGEPKTYSAGQLTAGTDIPIGKYKIYDGNSNFTVHSASGRLEVNIILGKGSYEVPEYIYTFKTGDTIKANSAFKIVAVE